MKKFILLSLVIALAACNKDGGGDGDGQTIATESVLINTSAIGAGF